jgi:acetyltransferase-like isoleucine patch superfamily enzyme
LLAAIRWIGSGVGMLQSIALVQPRLGLEPAADPLIDLGEGYQLDPNVTLGYRTGRPIADHALRIGANAVIRSGSVIYGGSQIGEGLQTGHNVIIREESVIGDHFSLWNNSTIDYGCRIGNNVKIHANAYIAQFTVIEDDVFMAPGVTVANDIHPGCAFSAQCMRGPTIKRGAQIGVNVTLLPFITIGEHAVIGSGTVVTKDVPPYAVVCGNPGRVVKEAHELRCVTGITDKPYHY